MRNPTTWRVSLGHPAAVALLICALFAWAAVTWLPPLRPWSERAPLLLLWGALGYLVVVFVLRRSRPEPAAVSAAPEVRQLRAIRQAMGRLLEDREAQEVQTSQLTRVLAEAVQTLDEQIEPTLRELVQREQTLRAHLAQWERGELPPPEPSVLDRLRAIQVRQRTAIDTSVQQAANAQATLVALIQEGDDSTVATRAWEWADHLLTLYDVLAGVLRGQDELPADIPEQGGDAETEAEESPLNIGRESVKIIPNDADDISDQDLQRLTEEALRRLHNTEALTRCGLIELLPRTLAATRDRWTDRRPTGPTALAQGRALREVLEEAIQRMAPAGGNGSLQYQILHEEYVLGSSNKRIITRHEIPDVTFYRQRREGILVLARELKQQEEGLAQQESRDDSDDSEASLG